MTQQVLAETPATENSSLELPSEIIVSPKIKSQLEDQGYKIVEQISSNVVTHCRTFLLERNSEQSILKVHFDTSIGIDPLHPTTEIEALEMWRQEVGLLRQAEQIATRDGTTAHVQHIELFHPQSESNEIVAAYIVLKKSTEAPLKTRTTPLNPLADEVELLQALEGFLKGLSTIHKAGRAHRDINENNLLFTKDGVVIDLNLARPAAVSLALGSLDRCGYTYPPYALGGFGKNMQSADLYALGVTLIAASQGKTTEDLINLFNLDDGGFIRVDLLTSNMSPKVAQFLGRLCTSDIKHTYKSAVEALKDFKHFFRDSKQEAMPDLVGKGKNRKHKPKHSLQKMAKIDLVEIKDKRRAALREILVPDEVTPTNLELKDWKFRFAVLSKIDNLIEEAVSSGRSSIIIISHGSPLKDKQPRFYEADKTLKELPAKYWKLLGVEIKKPFSKVKYPDKPSSSEDINSIAIRTLCNDLTAKGLKIEFTSGDWGRWGLKINLD